MKTRVAIGLVLCALMGASLLVSCAEGQQPAPAPPPAPPTTPEPTDEQVDEVLFSHNFSKIYLTHVPKAGETPTTEMMTTQVTDFDASETGIGMVIFATPDLDTSIKVTVKVFETEGGALLFEQPFSETALKPSCGQGEAFPMAMLNGVGQYRIKFYADDVLVKVIDFEVK